MLCGGIPIRGFIVGSRTRLRGARPTDEFVEEYRKEIRCGGAI
jgi:hypothetical protein